MIPTAYICGSVYGIAQLKRKLIELDTLNRNYWYSQLNLLQPAPDYSHSEEPPLPETIKAPEM